MINRERVANARMHLWIRVRHSNSVRFAGAVAGLPSYTLQRMRSGNELAVDLYEPIGLGAILSKALLFYAHAERRGMSPCIFSSNPLYTPPEQSDFLPLLFERPPSSPLHAISGRSFQAAARLLIKRHIPLSDARRLFAEHFRPNNMVRETVRDVLAGRAAFDLSIHFRGTDKIFESGKVQHRTALAAIEKAVEKGARDIFLATDDPTFEVTVKNRFDRCKFTSFNLGFVNPGTPRHFSQLSPYDKALEALANIALLGAAPCCIRTSSFLSAISPIMAPSLKTVTINRTRDGSTKFPEAEVLASEVSA